VNEQKSLLSAFRYVAALSGVIFLASGFVGAGQLAAVPPTLVVTVDAGFEADDGVPDVFRVMRRASALEISVNGSPPMLVDSEDVVEIHVIGSSDNDTLIVDTSGGNPIPDGGLTFEGREQSGPPGDALRVIGNGANRGAYEVSTITSGTGTLRLDERVIRFTGLEPVEVSGLAVFTFTTPNSDDVLTISAGTGSGGQPANVIAGTSGGTAFEALTFFDVTLFIIDTGSNDAASAGNDSITIDSSGLIARNLQSLNIFSGRGDDTLSIQADKFSLPSPGGAFVFEGGSGSDRIVAQADVKFALSDSQLMSSGGGAINLLNIENADLIGGTNANSFVVSDWSGFAVLDGRESGDAYVVNLGGGGLVVINDTSLVSVDQGTINGTGSNDTFAVTAARTVAGNDTVYYANLETIAFNGLGGDDTFTVGPVTNALLTIDGGPQPNGDNLLFDLAGVTAPRVTGASPATFGNRLPVSFLNFEQLGPTATISGTVYHDVDGNQVKNPDEPGLAGWTVLLDRNFDDTADSGDLITTTDASGNYVFADLLPNTYRVRELAPDGWLQTSANPPDIVLAGTNRAGVDFGNFQTIAISGQVYQDDNRNGQRESGEIGLQGRKVFLDQNNNGVFDPDEPFRTTISGGNYSFLKLGPGTYRVRQSVQSGSIQTSAQPADIVAASGVDHSSVDFGNAPPDTIPPTAPLAPDLIASSDTGLSSSDNITSASNLVFQGTAEPNSTVELFVNNVLVGTNVADAVGNYSIGIGLNEGVYQITAGATDAAGNSSPHSTVMLPLLVVDSTAPPAPSVPDLVSASDTGASDTDNITSDISPTFQGTAEANATILLFANGTLAGSSRANENGQWTVTVTNALVDGTFEITARAVDLAGNFSPVSLAAAITIDLTIAPSLEIALVGDRVVVSWPNPSTGFQLEASDIIGVTATWSTVETPPVVVGDGKLLAVTVPSSWTKFSRLRKP